MESGEVTQDEKLWGMLAHLLTLVGYVIWVGAYVVPLVIYIVYKEKSKFVAFHALQSLFFQLAALVAGIVLLIPSIFCLFLPIFALAVGVLVYVILAAIKAYNGELFEYWLVGQWARKMVGI